MIFSLKKSVWALFFSYLCMFALASGDNIRGALFPELIKFYNISNSTGSLSFALASAAAFVGTVISVLALRKIQLDKLITLAIFLMAVGLLCMGLSAQFNFYLLGTFIFGFGMGTTGVAQNLLIAENVEDRIKTKALSGLHGIYGLSSFTAPYIASRSPQFFQNHLPKLGFLTDWRAAFFITASLCTMVLVTLLLTQPQPHFSSIKPDENAVPMPKAKKPFVFLSIFFASYVGAEILLSTRLALYMRTYFNMSFEESSNYVTYFFIFLLIGRLFFAFKTINKPLKHQLNASLILSLVFFILGLVAHPFCLTIVGLTMAPFYPIAVAYISDITGPYKRKYLTFVMGVQSLFVILMHLGVGYLTDIFGLFYAFGVGIILLILSFICLNTHPKIYSN